MNLLINKLNLELPHKLLEALYKYYSEIVVNDYSPTVLSFHILFLLLFSKIIINRSIKQKLFLLVFLLALPNVTSLFITIDQSRVALQYILITTLIYIIIKFCSDILIRKNQSGLYLTSIIIMYFYSLFAVGQYIDIDNVFVMKSLVAIEITKTKELIDLQYFTVLIVNIIILCSNKIKSQNIWKEN